MTRVFEDLAPREETLSGERTITDQDVRTFATLTGDENPIHLSDEAAQQGRFGRRVAHGALVFSISVGLLQKDQAHWPDVLAFVGVERLRFVRPVFLGDTIRVRQTVRSVDPVDAGTGMIEAREEVLNQAGDVVLSYTAKMLVRRRGP
jgi:acyl dehydratase